MTGSLARPDHRRHLAIACAIVLISLRPAFAGKIQCRDLSTADADELLATVDKQSIKYGGGVRARDYDCYPYPGQKIGQKVCDWKTSLEDDRMLDHDYRLIYVLSSHQTGSGSWGDLLVFGCVSGQVKTVFVGQFGSQETKTPSDIFESAPPALRPVLEEYMKHPGRMPPQ